MENISLSEFGTDDDKLKAVNRIVDNIKQIEGKLEQQIDVNDAYNAEVEEYNDGLLTKKKGFVGMKLLIFLVVFISLFAGVAHAQFKTTDITYANVSNPTTLERLLRDLFANQVSNTFVFTPTTQPSSADITQGMMYFDSSTNTFKGSIDGTSFTPFDTAGGVSLDSAYNFGSGGGGKAITVDNGAVAFTATNAADNIVLAIVQADTSSAVAQTITSAGTGALLTFTSNGTGADILGSGSAWTITKDGKATFNGGGEIDTADFLFDATSAGKDLEWDDSQFALHFLDSTVLGLGGATDATPDFTFIYDGTDLNLDTATADLIYRMGETNNFDFVIHGATNTNEITFDTDDSALAMIVDGFSIIMNDNDVFNHGDSKEFATYYDEASTDNLLIVALNANDAVQYGDGTSSSTDVKMMGATDGDFAIFDSSADELFLEDYDLKINEGSQIEFSVGDNTVDWTIDVSTDDTLLFLPALSNGTASYNIGDATNTSDVRIFGETASTVVFDATGDKVDFDKYDIGMGDGDIITLGDGDDLSMSATGETVTFTLAAGSIMVIADTDNSASLLTLGTSGTNGLDVLFQGATSGDIVDWDAGADTWNFGVDATGVDVVFHSDTTLKFMKWIETSNILSLDGATAMLEFRGASVDAHETTLAVVEPTASNIVTLPDDTGSLTYMAEAGTANFGAPGTLPLTDAVVLMTSTGADAITLPDGVSAGQILSVVLVAQSGGAATLTPTSVTGSGWATMVFTNVGESASFMYIDSTIGWTVLGTSGVSTQPLITQ